MRCQLLLIAFAIVLCSCGKKKEVSRGNSPIEDQEIFFTPQKIFKYSYSFSFEGCETGEKVFSSDDKYSSKIEMCETLLDDELNNHCARESREQYYKEKCMPLMKVVELKYDTYDFEENRWKLVELTQFKPQLRVKESRIGKDYNRAQKLLAQKLLAALKDCDFSLEGLGCADIVSDAGEKSQTEDELVTIAGKKYYFIGWRLYNVLDRKNNDSVNSEHLAVRFLLDDTAGYYKVKEVDFFPIQSADFRRLEHSYNFVNTTAFYRRFLFPLEPEKSLLNIKVVYNDFDNLERDARLPSSLRRLLKSTKDLFSLHSQKNQEDPDFARRNEIFSRELLDYLKIRHSSGKIAESYEYNSWIESQAIDHILLYPELFPLGIKPFCEKVDANPGSRFEEKCRKENREVREETRTACLPRGDFFTCSHDD